MPGATMVDKMFVSQGSAKVVENPKVEKHRSRDGAICRRIVEVSVQIEPRNQHATKNLKAYV